MKTKTNFATTSDVRNLINATMETFPKGPVRDGIQTKMFNFWDNLNAANNLPAGSDQNRFHAEALDNYKAAIRMAVSLGSKRDSSYEFKVTELERRLSKIKVGKNEMAKVEDNFYGKRVVKGIFAKAKFNFRDVGDAHQKAIAIKTLKNPAWALTGGITAEEAESILRKKFNYTDKQIAELKKYEGSRTGSKAKFADDGRAKALVILQQLGGNMFVAMTGAKNLSTESNPPALSMKVGSGAQNKVKHLKVVLDEGSDTYTMIFFDSKGSTIKKLDHVYAEDLRRIFTEVTGFYTSLTRHSRQGSKAKMASQLRKQQPYEVLYYKWFAGVQVNIMDMGKIKNEINAIIASGANPEIEMPKLVKKYGSFSRTGSKAKFAKEYILWAVPKGKTDTMYSQPIAEQLYTDAQINDVKRRATADGWHTFRIAEMMSFEDMTNAFKGKPVKRRSSRTGAKVFK